MTVIVPSRPARPIRVDGGGRIPAGGTTGQALVKSADADYATTWATVSGGGGVADGDKGDITVSGSGAAWTIDAGAVTVSKMADLAASTILGNNTGGAAAPIALSAAQATALLDAFTSGAKGLVPASGGGTTNFLRADGTFAAPPGGGGSGDVAGPASATDNALARFDTTTGKLIQDGVVTLSDAGALTVPNSALPSAPASGNVTIFALDRNGKSLPAFIDPEGFMTTVQADLGEFNVARFMPEANTTTAADAGVPLTNTGTFAAAAIATTNFFTMKRRLLCQVTVAATTAVAGVRGSQNAVRIGRTAGAPGGFSSRIVWGPSTGVSTATTRAFCGFRATAAPTDVNPSSLLNLVGMGWDSGDTNVQMMTNDGAGTATKTDLGASFPRPNTDNTTVYELQLYSPNSTTQSVNWRVIRYDTTGKTIAAEATGTITTDLPANTVLMAPHVWMSVGGTSSVIGVACMGITIVDWY